MTPNRRRTDRWRWLIRANAYRDVWMLALTGLIYLSLSTGADEAVIRRDQTCTVFERMHQADIRQLRSTYQYLERLPESEANSSLNAAIALQLPTLEEQVRDGKPPAYCAKPGVGLDDLLLEKPPHRPAGLRVP